MFGNLKTKGFALEATHLTDPKKLCTLLALLAFALGATGVGLTAAGTARPRFAGGRPLVGLAAGLLSGMFGVGGEPPRMVEAWYYEPDGFLVALYRARV